MLTPKLSESFVLIIYIALRSLITTPWPNLKVPLQFSQLILWDQYYPDTKDSTKKQTDPSAKNHYAKLI